MNEVGGRTIEQRTRISQPDDGRTQEQHPLLGEERDQQQRDGRADQCPYDAIEAFG